MAQVGIVIRTYNEEALLARTLKAVQSQDETDYRLVVVDSGSTDKTLDIVRNDSDATLIEIPQSEFSFGKSLNIGINSIADEADFAVLLSAHAIPKTSEWLHELLEPFQRDQRIAGTFGKQIPLEEHLANPIVRAMAAREYPVFFDDEPYQSDTDHRFSNSNSAIRVSAWRETKFDEDAGFAEDQIWSRQMLESGFLIAYQPSAVVYHSHPDSFFEFYKRQLTREREFRKQGFTENQRRLRRLIGRQWNALRDYLTGVARSRSLGGIRWDTLRTDFVSNWAWYQAGREKSDGKRN